jgi:hypothetical protein
MHAMVIETSPLYEIKLATFFQYGLRKYGVSHLVKVPLFCNVNYDMGFKTLLKMPETLG